MRKASQARRPAPEPEKFERWTAQRKAAIILDVLKAIILDVLKGKIRYRKPRESMAAPNQSSANGSMGITVPASTRSRSTRKALRQSTVPR
jgi:hypothetical protein